MAKKEKEAVIERFAILCVGRVKKKVKVWQYYSIFDYCRSAGCNREESDKIARWCRDSAKHGEERQIGDMSIRIIEQTV